jgi:putative hydrolase of HD superfamily
MKGREQCLRLHNLRGVSIMSSIENLIDLFELAGKLKQTERTGWTTQLGIRKPESVADHSYRCAIMGLFLSNETGTDILRLVQMLLLHDLHESVIGDLDKPTKIRMGPERVRDIEDEAVSQVASALPDNLRREYTSVWHELMEGATSEAVLATDIDKLEMALQALEYERQGYPREKLEEFWRYVDENVKTPIGQDILRVLRKRRQ